MNDSNLFVVVNCFLKNKLLHCYYYMLLLAHIKIKQFNIYLLEINMLINMLICYINIVIIVAML